MIPPIFIGVVYFGGVGEQMNLDVRSNYSRTMLILWLMHFISFLINRRSLSKQFFDNTQIDDFKRLDTEQGDMLIHRPVFAQFKTTKSLWFVQGMVYFYVLYVYYYEHGTQMIVDLWIPLDFLIFLSMAIYAFICYRKAQQEKSQ